MMLALWVIIEDECCANVINVLMVCLEESIWVVSPICSHVHCSWLLLSKQTQIVNRGVGLTNSKAVTTKSWVRRFLEFFRALWSNKKYLYRCMSRVIAPIPAS